MSDLRSDIPERIQAMLGKRVRVFAASPAVRDHVMAEGVVIGYAPAPTIVIRCDDGTQEHWQITLPIEVLPDGPSNASWWHDPSTIDHEAAIRKVLEERQRIYDELRKQGFPVDWTPRWVTGPSDTVHVEPYEPLPPLGCPHLRTVDIHTYDDLIRLQGRARVHLCNDCGERIEVPT